jgi:pimeloyl-ACP methyl ester carboxylesterase
MDDVRAVMDAVGSKRAALLGTSEGGAMSAVFAATYPHGTSALIMIGSHARRRWAPDYLWAETPEETKSFLDHIEHRWGGPVGPDRRAPRLAADTRFQKWWATYLRVSASP